MPDQGKTSLSAGTSLAAGTSIVAGCAVGAGMFSLPVVSAGMWFSWSFVLLLFTWFCMYHSSLMILEANLNFEPGASFDTFVKDILGPRWNAVNGLSLTFVLYILTYAYVSGGGSIVRYTLENSIGVTLPITLAGLVFALGLAAVVWVSTALVGRITSILVVGMVISFLLSAGGLTLHIDLPLLLAVEPGWMIYSFAAIPYFLTAFGYHGVVPSLFKYYGPDVRRIRFCLLAGSLFTLAVYLLWMIATLGNIEREAFGPIIAAGGNIGDLVNALGSSVDRDRLTALLNAFANMAVVSSFLGVGLCLFDFIADRFKFDDTAGGRLKTALVTFAPPTLGGLLFPDGFLYAIGLAGLSACIWGAIVPALAARGSRLKYGSPRYRVWGGNGLVYLVIAYGIGLLICYLLSAAGLLPTL
jgi:tryptophan-specific transport protein